MVRRNFPNQTINPTNATRVQKTVHFAKGTKTLTNPSKPESVNEVEDVSNKEMRTQQYILN